jgi:hypothetical protein
MGKREFDIPASVNNIQYLSSSNCIIDEIHLQSIIEDSSTKEGWSFGTVLLASLNGDLEAGNIQMRENPISYLRVKRREVGSTEKLILKDYDFSPDPQTLVHDDYTCLSNKHYEYIVVPVDASGIEGSETKLEVECGFTGWWIVDMDNPTENNFQFLYNLDDVSIKVDEDRKVIKTFGKHPIVRYGMQRAKKGRLSGLVLPYDGDVLEQVEKFDAMLAQHKPLLLKNSQGRGYIVDISAPEESISSELVGVSRVSVDWIEVGDYNDFVQR